MIAYKWNALGNLDDNLGLYWGYTNPEKPNWYGYINPNPYLENDIRSINPTPIKVTVNQPVRTGPGTDYTNTFGTVSTGQKFVAFSECNGWYQIYIPSRYGPATGWIRGTADSSSTIIKINDPTRVSNPTNGVSIRDNPTTSANAVTYVWDKQQFVMSGKSTEPSSGKLWYKIYLPNGLSSLTGWVCSDYVNAQTLSVSLTTNPSSETAPLKGVDFTATVSGNATDTINYTFYANRSDDGINITPDYCFKIDGRNPNGTGGTVIYKGSATSWNGGTTFTVRNVYNYTSAGTYTAKVIAEQGSASPAEARVTITVSGPTAPPKAQFTTSTTSGNAPLTVQFTDQSTGNITSYSWNFGDGGTGTTQNPSHTYTTAGNYTVSLIVTGSGGSDTKTKRGCIQVNTPPLPPDFTFVLSSPATQTIAQGGSTSYVISLKSISGYNLPVYLSVSGISPSPGNDNPMTCSLSSSLVTPSDPPATATLNVITLRTAIPQTYTIFIRGQDGTKIHDTSVQLVVNPSLLNGSISGKVYEEESGNPLDGVAIQATQVTQFGNWQQRGSTTTQSGGSYRMQGLIPGQYYIYARRSGFGTVIKTDIPVLSGQETSNQNLSMTNNPGWIYGTVKDNTNTAVGNIGVQASIKGTNGNTYYINGANTASGTGYYELRDLGAGNSYQVKTNGTTIDNIDYVAPIASGVSVQKGQGTNINLVLQPAAKIFGTVKDAQGNPVKGVTINCWADNGNIGGNGDTTTDGSGNYKDYSLRYLLPGYTYTVDVIPPSDTDYVIQRFQVNVPSAGSYERDITLQGGAIKISGNVKVKATQQPPQDTAVRIGYWNRQYSASKDVYVNQQDGNYVLTNLPKGGEVEISVRPESLYAWDGMVTSLQQDAVVNFELVPEAIISGVIKDFDTGLPVTAGLEIYYSNEEKGVGARISTNPADGTFALTGLPSGLTEVTFEPRVETGYAWKRTYFYLSEGEHRINIELLIKKGALVSGSLKDTAGIGIPNKEILINGSGGEETKVYSDYSGNFQIRLSGGNYVASLVDTDMRDWTVIPLEFTITGPADNKTIELIGYDPSNASYISGEVIDTGGYPKTSTFIVVAIKAGMVWNKETIRNPEFVSMATLDNVGPYQLMVPPGHTYDLYLGVFDGKVVSSFTKRDSMVSVSGGSTGQDLYYNSVGGTISGVVTYNGKPVIMATVFLTDLVGNFAGIANTVDAVGTYHLYNVPAGDYIASTWHPDYGNSGNFSVNGVTDNGTVTADIVIQ